MVEPAELSSSSAADPALRDALDRIAHLEEQLQFARREAELTGRACDAWRSAALAQAQAHAEVFAELHRLQAEAP